MTASDYAENKILDHMLGTASWTMPTQVYVKLHTGAAGEAGTSNAAGNTTRQAADFAASSGGAASNSGAVSWSSVSTTETYSHFSLWDASSGGNCLADGALSVGVAVTAGDTFTIAIGDLDVTCT